MRTFAALIVGLTTLSGLPVGHATVHPDFSLSTHIASEKMSENFASLPAPAIGKSICKIAHRACR